MTVYNQFESKAGLLEALFDSLAQRGLLASMREIFNGSDPLIVLDEYVALFGRFWTLNRRTHRRLRAAAMHDDELAAAIANRNERRRRGVTEMVRRLAERSRPVVEQDEIVNVVYVLLSFDTFDALAGETRTPEQVAPIVGRLIRAVLQLNE